MFAMFALAAGLALTATPATPSAYLRMLDGNGDQRVDLSEYQAWMAVGFAQMDSNGNGIIEVNEMPPSPRARHALTRAQHRSNVAATFKRSDTNHDGLLDSRELAAPPR
ncbi:MAG: hypothetical protein L0H70_09760 [Xanthomonadales bacterium]|nr:hypothetical protein [Xanthomonadales bacterium]